MSTPMPIRVPFNRPHLTGREQESIAQVLASRHLAGDGPFTKVASGLIEENTGAHRALLTHSCTAALEMAALLLDLREGDEVILPSFTFVSTANAFALRGAVPVFVDIHPDSLNIDECLIEAAITPRTRAIAPVHYAGVGCEMDAIMDIAQRHALDVVEDAAQGYCASYRGQALGTFGRFGTFSFHETKNIVCGEGGALLVNRAEDALNAEIIREKGTNRAQFFRGQVDKYSWQAVGSSYLPSEVNAAFLCPQLEDADTITALRLSAWSRYHHMLASLEHKGLLIRPRVPDHCTHNGHLYHILLDPEVDRDAVLARLRQDGIQATFHYVPLHSSAVGQKIGRAHGELPVTNDLWARLIRLPLWADLSEADQNYVVTKLTAIVEDLAR